jgi:hypothetical protein
MLLSSFLVLCRPTAILSLPILLRDDIPTAILSLALLLLEERPTASLGPPKSLSFLAEDIIEILTAFLADEIIDNSSA